MKISKLLLPINICVLILLVVNIVLTIKLNDQQPIAQELNNAKTILSNISKNDLDKITNKLVNYSNNDNYTGIYNMFSEYAKNQITIEQTTESAKKIANFAGDVKKNYYEYNEYLGYKSGADWYNVFYIAEFDKGPGSIKLTFRIIEDNVELVGFKYTIDEV